MLVHYSLDFDAGPFELIRGRSFNEHVSLRRIGNLAFGNLYFAGSLLLQHSYHVTLPANNQPDAVIRHSNYLRIRRGRPIRRQQEIVNYLVLVIVFTHLISGA
jgi:hypothetical protein